MAKKKAQEINIIGHIVDIPRHRIYDGVLHVLNGKILAITPLDDTQGETHDATAAAASPLPYILPPFVDSHIHIESTLLTPHHYARLAVTKGVTCAVADPHEIANVLGEDGIDFMINDSRRALFHFHFGAPSCVPSTPFETAGATLDAKAVTKLLKRKDIYGLAEMMNYPGLLAGDKDVLVKVDAALKLGKPIDGHAPGLRGDEAKRYIDAGITTDHECTTLQEAEERIKLGMKILIREGSAACNLDALCYLLTNHDKELMFCSDDLYADDMIKGYIDECVRRTIAKGMPFWNVLAAACLTPLKHYNFPHGTLAAGDPADFICVDNFRDMNVLRTFVDGVEVYNKAEGVLDDNFLLARPQDNGDDAADTLPNHFHAHTLRAKDLVVTPKGDKMRCIVAKEGELYTTCRMVKPLIKETGKTRNVVSDPQHDVLKLVVLNRYDEAAQPSIAFIEGFGLKSGAIASTIAHDSHNIIATGCNDEEIAHAINRLVLAKGGLCICNGNQEQVLALPVAGLMSPESGEEVARQHQALRKKAHEQGCCFSTPFMTLAFMALPVIPELKLTDKGLFDSEKFMFAQLFE